VQLYLEIGLLIRIREYYSHVPRGTAVGSTCT
jgi:hypothetical protein